MTERKSTTPGGVRRAPAPPESGMTPDEARALASGVAARLADRLDGSPALLLLLLRWLAYRADDNQREELYLQLEAEHAAGIEGVAEAIEAHLSREMAALRRRRAQRGGAR